MCARVVYCVGGVRPSCLIFRCGAAHSCSNPSSIHTHTHTFENYDVYYSPRTQNMPLAEHISDDEFERVSHTRRPNIERSPSARTPSHSHNARRPPYTSSSCAACVRGHHQLHLNRTDIRITCVCATQIVSALARTTLTVYGWMGVFDGRARR